MNELFVMYGFFFFKKILLCYKLRASIFKFFLMTKIDY